MKTINRTKYFLYYLKELEYDKFSKFLNYTCKVTGKSKTRIIADVINSIYKYNIGIMDYFIFRFFEKDEEERSKWVGTGYKYEFDLKTNPKRTREILENKIKFYEAYKPFINHVYCTVDDLLQENKVAVTLFSNDSGKIVVKDSLGQCGWDVEVVKASEFSPTKLAEYMKSKGFDLAEEFIQQHQTMNELSPTGLNTVRMITMINKEGGVDILGARMRISVNNHVDNLASGNIACPIDITTGKITGKGVYSDITKNPVDKHPITEVPLIGFEIPMWEELVKTTREIALFRPENKGVGWDVAVTSNGPDFVEGNHNWCKILWQLPVNKGLKHILQKYE